MKSLIIIVWTLLIFIVLLIAGYLCYKGINGWGWFLFCGILLAAFSYSEKNDEDENKETE